MAIPTHIRSLFSNSGKANRYTGVPEGAFPVFVDGKQTKSYITWTCIKDRCYNPVKHKSAPTYIGCSIDPRWYDYQDFAKWFAENYVEGYHLDKDILVPGNKIYGPDTCCFIPQSINSLYTSNNAIRGKYPVGLTRQATKLQIWLNAGGKQKSLGYVADTPEGILQGFKIYVEAKLEHANKVIGEANISPLVKELAIVTLRHQLQSEADAFGLELTI